MDTFELLVLLLSEQLDNFHGGKVSSGGTKLLSKENLVALLLNWLREYPSVRSLAVTFDVPKATIMDSLPRLVDILRERLRSWVGPPRIRRKWRPDS